MANLAKGYMAKIGLDLSSIDKQIRTLQNELKQVDKALIDNSDNATLVNQRYKILSDTAQLLADKLQLLTDKRSDASDAAEKGIIDPEQFRAYQREIINTSDAFNQLRTSMGEVANEQAIAQAREDIVGDLSTIQDQVADWTQSIAEFGAQVGEVLIGVAKECAQVGQEFESSMASVAAIAGVDKLSEEYQKLEKAALDTGKTTRYTAAQSAEALKMLSLAGFEADESIELLPQVLNMALASGMDFGQTSEMLTNAIHALGIEMDGVSDFVDKMAVTASSSGTSMEQLGNAILTVGGTARNVSGGIAEIDTVLGILADNGIKASEGGTKLRNVLTTMAKPTKGTKKLLDELNMDFYDMEGNLRPLPEIFVEMREKMDALQLTQKERDNLITSAFNKRDLAAINALLNTTADRYDELSDKINKSSGAAETMQKTMNDTLEGALYQLTSARQDLEIKVYKKVEDSLKDIVNLTADTVRGISTIFEDESVGRQFTEAFQHIADVIRQEMPNIIKLFEDFAVKIVPRLGDLTAEIIELVGDEMLPKFIKVLSWIVDNGAAVESAIKLIIGAMVVDKVGKFGQGLFNVATGIGNINSAIVDLAAKAPTAAGGLTSIQTSANGAAAGAAAASSALGGILIVGEALIAVAALVANKLDDMGEAALRNTKYMNDFSDASNKALQDYSDNASGKFDDRTLKEADEAIAKRRQDIEDIQNEIFDLNDRIKSLNHKKKQLEKQKDAAGLLWGLGDTADAKKELDSINAQITDTTKKANELRRDLEIYNLALHEEEDTRERIAEEQRKLNKSNAMNAAQNDYSAKKRDEYWAAANPEEAARKKAEDEENARKIDEEAFATSLECEEEKWDKKYHWDKKNQEEYWREKEQFLKENEIDSKEWWEAWNETEAKLGKLDSNTEKDIQKNLKEAEQKVKDALDSYKAKLKLAVANGMSEYEANEALGRYIDTHLDKSTDLYAKEQTDYLNTKTKLDEQFTKDQETEYNNNKKAQEELIKNKYRELEIQANNEGWSERKLWNEKMRFLKKMKSDNEVYLEVYESTLMDLREDQSKIIKKEREAREAQAEKDNEADKKSLEKQNEQRQKIFDAAEKEAEDVVKKYYQNNRDEIAKYAQSSKTVTDANGKEHLVFTDYSKKLQELKAYQKNLEKLKTMGLTTDHLKEIFSMDLDTRMKYISELVNMGAGYRQKYLSDYNAYQRVKNSVAESQMYFQQDEISAEIKDKYDELTKDSELSGEQNAYAYQKGWEKGMSGYDFGIDLLPSEITTGAADWQKSQQNGLSKLLKLSEDVMDLNNKILGTSVNINIDNQKSAETSIKKLLTKTMNSASKAFG